MKVGDAVRFIGFPGASNPFNSKLHPLESKTIGLIIAARRDNSGNLRLCVYWSNGAVGNYLYEETLELINET